MAQGVCLEDETWIRLAVGWVFLDLQSFGGGGEKVSKKKSNQNNGPYPKVRGIWAIILGTSEVQVLPIRTATVEPKKVKSSSRTQSFGVTDSAMEMLQGFGEASQYLRIPFLVPDSSYVGCMTVLGLALEHGMRIASTRRQQ